MAAPLSRLQDRANRRAAQPERSRTVRLRRSEDGVKKSLVGLTVAVTLPPLIPAQAEARYRRDWREWRRYDYNGLPPGQRDYYADRYWRDRRSYRERRLTWNDRSYPGRDYCRRSDGTVGLIIGGAIGGLIGNALDNGRSRLLGTLLGAGGALLGLGTERGQVRRR
jgi:hypothetical protein